VTKEQHDNLKMILKDLRVLLVPEGRKGGGIGEVSRQRAYEVTAEALELLKTIEHR
jgi:hypothetical protein